MPNIKFYDIANTICCDILITQIMNIVKLLYHVIPISSSYT